MFSLMRNYRGEAGIKSAYEADSDGLASIIEVEIAHHKPMCDRDHACRDYVSMLRRVMKQQDGDEQAKHDAKMKEVLAALKKKEETQPNG